MQDAVSRVAQFREFASQLVPEGWSGNAILRSARDVGFGIQRSDALAIIREIRSTARPVAEFAAGEIGIPVIPSDGGFKWGNSVQETDEWQRFDGPNAIMFQNTDERPDDWLDFVIVPEDEDYIGQRFVVQDDDYIDPERPGSGYRTTQPLPADISPAEAARRLGIDPGKVARIIYDKP